MRAKGRPERDDAHLIETTVASERVWQGKLLDVRRDSVRLPDDGIATREYIVHPGAVLVLPVLPDERLVTVRQYRYPLRQVFIEFPAGKLDPGESALTTAVRELQEEAGYTAREWTPMGVIHPLLAYSTEAIWIYLAEGLEHVGAALDDGEFLEVGTMSVDEMLAGVDRGEITDAKTVTALLLYARRRERRVSAKGAAAVARRLVIRGRVQGVGFRHAMSVAATSFGVTGWVRNRPDGSVEALVQGVPDAVERATDWCRRGPPSARVTAVEAVDEPPAGDRSDFVMRPTV